MVVGLYVMKIKDANGVASLLQALMASRLQIPAISSYYAMTSYEKSQNINR